MEQRLGVSKACTGGGKRSSGRAGRSPRRGGRAGGERSSQPCAGAAEGGGFGIQPRPGPFLVRLWQEGNKNTPVPLRSDDKRRMRSEVGTQRFAALLLNHTQILLCLRHPILQLCTCSRGEPCPAVGTDGSHQAEARLGGQRAWLGALAPRGLLTGAAGERGAGSLCTSIPLPPAGTVKPGPGLRGAA